MIPDDRRGTAATGNFGLPLDILGGTPLDAIAVASPSQLPKQLASDVVAVLVIFPNPYNSTSSMAISW